eukprot:TRINITY_DN1895_c0_g1_i7.p1 TRINITY_DN1895_c0_g1~~TRINITY_DN1895_c0_g1_i7.p1  ORF type:complete len:257 (+),score=64.03 TRINITY_DN1895_c0_g1_i7:166-936(+)
MSPRGFANKWRIMPLLPSPVAEVNTAPELSPPHFRVPAPDEDDEEDEKQAMMTTRNEAVVVTEPLLPEEKTMNPLHNPSAVPTINSGPVASSQEKTMNPLFVSSPPEQTPAPIVVEEVAPDMTVSMHMNPLLDNTSHTSGGSASLAGMVMPSENVFYTVLDIPMSSLSRSVFPNSLRSELASALRLHIDQLKILQIKDLNRESVRIKLKVLPTPDMPLIDMEILHQQLCMQLNDPHSFLRNGTYTRYLSDVFIAQP